PEWAYVSGITVNSHTLLLDEVELLSGTDYYFSVQADCNGDGSLTSAYAEDYFFSTPGLNACTAPANVQAPLATINETTAQVSWDALAGSPVYEIYYRLTGASTWQSAMTYDAFINLSALVSGMEYQAQVRVFCSGDWSVVSEFSDIITFTTTGIIACEAPTVAGSTPISDTSQGIVFNSPGGGMYYDVKYRVQGIISWSIARSTTGPAITLSNLLPGTPYQVMVRADCSGTGDGSINSDYSSIYTFITSGTSTCVGPQGIAVSSITDTGATVSWGVGTGALSYDMRYRLKGSTAWTTVSGPETQVVLSGLESGMTYQVQARSLCNVDATLQSVWSTTLEFTTTGTPACDVPIGLTASSITDTGANITWTVANGAQEYEVRYRVSGTYTWTITATPSASISLNGLATGMPYQLRVRSICNADGSLLSGFSDIFSFSTTGAAACAIPTSLVANNITEQSTDLTWSPASGAVEYEVRYRPSGTTLWESINTATNTLTLSGLLPSEEYQWRVRTICSTDGTLASQFSTVSTFLTTAPPPVAPPAGRSEGDETVTAVDDTESKEVVQLLTTPLLNVYPNPFRHTLYFEYTPVEDEDITLLIFHLNGKKVAEVFSGKVWAQQQLRFSFVPQNLPKGMYIYRLISDKGPGMTSRIVLN
ncbi:MAG: fibronectin type III domain-containing protein, partial [Cyclobacteriaceae bacterium]|nr:fibronectin type III domain-containing protein [Cyclobacteriaceae bacterium]